MALKSHQTSRHSEKKLKCSKCDFRAVSEEILNKHMVISMAHKREQDCIYFQRSQCKFGSQCKYKHNLRQQNATTKAEGTSWFNCHVCKFWTVDRETLEQHIRKTAGHQRNLKCKFFARGMCNIGLCRFEHSMTYENNSQNFENQRQNNMRPDVNIHNSKNVMGKQCKFMNNCFRFPYCGYVHNEVCKYQENCKYEVCRFVHFNTDNYQSMNGAQNNMNPHFLGGRPIRPPWHQF